LHTGSFLVNPKETYIIDPEFSKLGPISFDLGMLLANLIMNNIVSEYHLRADTKKLEAFKRWINKTIETIWLETSRLFEANGKDVTKLKQETIGYCGIEIIRRIIGEAQIKDYLEIKDEHIRTRLERKSMQIAVNQLLDYGKSMEISYYLDQI